MRADGWFLGLTGVYFLIQAVMRTALGGSLEVDEAEMLLLADGWHLGYGPQLPLYNWAQVLVFDILGRGTAGLAFLKSAVLWLAAAGLWYAARAAFERGPDSEKSAVWVAALSLAFVPNILWEFQRASTHSIALLAAVTWTMWGWFALMRAQSLRRWAVLGVIVGLGGLAKANYWAVPVGLAVASYGYWRPEWRGLALAVAVAVGIVALPYAWAVMNPQQSLASVDKFYQDAPVVWPWLSGLGLLAGSVLAGLALPAMIGGALWALFARGRMGTAPVPVRILVRAAALHLLVAAVLVVVFDVTKIQARWLVPMFVFVVFAGFGWLGAALPARGVRAVPVLAVICAAITVAGMAQIRVQPGRTATLQFTALEELVQRLRPARVEGVYLLAGNLSLLQPDWDIVAAGTTALRGDWPDRLLVLGRVPNLPNGISQLDGGVVDLTYAGKPDKHLSVEWHLVGR